MKSNPLKITEKEFKELEELIEKDAQFRKQLAKESHFWFFYTYFSHYITYKPAHFHKEMFALTEDDDVRLAVIVAFRGSGKSTIMSLSYPIWAILGKQQRKYPLLVAQTQPQARQLLGNIKSEFENNKLLISDFGPFEEFADEWRSETLVLPKYGARISAISSGENVRGIRHKQTRPDLIVCDDVEDSNSVRFRENRDRTYNWFVGDIIPAGDLKTKIVVVGNLLHEDALINRLQSDIVNNERTGEFKAYPLVDAGGKTLWPDKFQNKDAIEKEKAVVGESALWEREYLLRIVPTADVLVRRDWIRKYNSLPNKSEELPHLAIAAVDLAISQKDSADFTAMVSAYIYGFGEDMRVYLLPHMVNKRLQFPDTCKEVQNLAKQIQIGSRRPLILVEHAGYQEALTHQLKLKGLRVEGRKVAGRDKRERLSLVTDYIQSGKVLFPKRGADLLIQQLTGFGIERHDDLADAFSILMNKIIESDSNSSGGLIIGLRNPIFNPRELGEGPVGFGNIRDKVF
ncbi:MAG: phage terminase large subunit [Patescibacteria group bacterium]|nr:phage terminase large subunit [Patescibacteria group bacterium]